MTVQSFDLKVASNGRVVLPRAVRERLGVLDEGKVILTIDDDEITLHSVAARVRRAQALYREHAKNPRTVDDFLADRRAEETRRDAALAPWTEN